MLRGIWGDPDRYQDTTGPVRPGFYFAGDGAKKDQDGDLWLLARVDDVMNISGHRISTPRSNTPWSPTPKVAEPPSSLPPTPPLARRSSRSLRSRADIATAIGDDQAAGEALIQELRNHVATQIGPIAKPRQILLSPELPKTRSGKIMRRLLRDVAEHRDLGDVTTLLDPTVVNAISERMAVAPTED